MKMIGLLVKGIGILLCSSIMYEWGDKIITQQRLNSIVLITLKRSKII